MLAYYCYNAILLLASPLLGLYLIYRRFVKGKEKGALRERLGFYDLPEAFEHPEKPVLWLHAVSVGEVVAAAPLVQAIKRHLDCLLVISTVTATGRAMIAKRRLPADAVVFLPFDYPWCVRRALRRVKPSLLILMESELWFNFIHIAQAKGVRLILANGRVSDRTAERGKRFKWYFKALYRRFDALCMQSEEDAQRALDFGAPPEKVQVVGNTKFEEPLEKLSEAEAAALRAELGYTGAEFLIVAGSTREGEEAKVLDAFEAIMKALPEARLLIAPRHLERVPEIEDLLRKRGFTPLLRTQKGASRVSEAKEVLILDTYGELARVYGLAKVAFLGGSLVNWGGQNLLQPLAHGVPAICGPYTHNFRSIVNVAKAAGVCFEVQDAAELAKVVLELSAQPEFLAAFPAKAQAFLEANKGASERTLKLIEALLQPDGGR